MIFRHPRLDRESSIRENGLMDDEIVNKIWSINEKNDVSLFNVDDCGK